MNISCRACGGTGTADGISCGVCDGDGVRDLFGAVSVGITGADVIHYIDAVFNALDAKLDDNAIEVADIKNKCDEIKKWLMRSRSG